MFWLLMGLAYAVLSRKPGAVSAAFRPPRAGRLIGATVDEGESGIKTWGTGLTDASGLWNPRYVKYVGIKDFRFGACLVQWRNDVAKGEKTAEAINRASEVIVNLLGYFFPIVKTFVENACLRFKFPLRRYQDPDGLGAYAIATVPPPPGLDAAAPPFPIPPRPGYDRAWVSYTRPNSARGGLVATVFWPGAELGGAPLMREVASGRTLRAMLRMADEDEGYPVGQIDPKKLAAEADGKSRFWLATKKKAMAEYK